MKPLGYAPPAELSRVSMRALIVGVVLTVLLLIGAVIDGTSEMNGLSVHRVDRGGDDARRRYHQEKEHEQQQENTTENSEDNSGEFQEDIEDYGLPQPDPMREGIDWVRDGRGRISHPIQKRAYNALHLLLDELEAAGHFPEEKDDQLADFVSGFMTVSTKLAGALGGIARGDDLFEPGMVIAWLKRILEILNQTIAPAGAIKDKRFLAAERFTYYRGELFVIREKILELITQLRAQ